MTRTTLSIWWTSALCLAVAACGAGETPPRSVAVESTPPPVTTEAEPEASTAFEEGWWVEFPGRTWYLIELDGAPRLNSLITSVVFSTDGKTVTGQSGCNSFGGSMEPGPDGTAVLARIETSLAACGDPTEVSLSDGAVVRRVGADLLEVVDATSGSHLRFGPDAPATGYQTPVTMPPPPTEVFVNLMPAVPNEPAVVPDGPSTAIAEVLPQLSGALAGARFRAFGVDGAPWIGIGPTIEFAADSTTLLWNSACTFSVARDGWLVDGALILGPTIDPPTKKPTEDPDEFCPDPSPHVPMTGDRIVVGDGGTRLEIHRAGMNGPYEFQRLDLPAADPSVTVGRWLSGGLTVDFAADGSLSVGDGCLVGTSANGEISVPTSLSNCWYPTNMIPPGTGVREERYRVLAGGSPDVIYLTNDTTSYRLLRST